MALRIHAIICVRNEQSHIAATLDYLAAQGIEISLVDHGSEDQTLALARPFVDAGMVVVHKLPWNGEFSLTEQLALKQSLAEASDCDWIIHTDADEWLQPPNGTGTLRSAIEAVDQQGYNCINFDEFVFVPLPEENFNYPGYRSDMRRYYFFEPAPTRLMRAWRRSANLTNTATGGHQLAGTLRLFPHNFILRHYLALSLDMVRHKYRTRVFSRQDLDKGWHRNRTNITDESLALRQPHRLKHLSRGQAADFDRSSPEKKHYWEW